MHPARIVKLVVMSVLLLVTISFLLAGRAFTSDSHKIVTNVKIQDLAPAGGSISLWLYPNGAFNSGTSEQIFFQLQSTDNNPEFSFQHAGFNNSLYAGFNGPGGDHRVVVAASGSNWNQNTWQNYVLTWVNGGATNLYHNGVLIGTNGGTTTVLTPAGLLWLGSGDFSSPAALDGRLAEFSIWNVALGDAEVALLSQGYSPRVIHSSALRYYNRLLGTQSPEPDIVGGTSATVTGSSGTSHPLILFPAPIVAGRRMNGGFVNE